MTAGRWTRDTVLGFYLRHQVLLTRYVEWLATERARRPFCRFMLRIITRGITRFVLVARPLTPEETTAQLGKASSIGVTRCVCGDCHDGRKEEVCLFLDDGYRVYRRHGPYPIRDIGRQEALALVNELRAAGHVQTTPVNPLHVFFFPQRYCICNCRLEHCFPLRFARRHGIAEGWGETIPRYYLRHHFVFWLSWLALPLFLCSVAVFRRRQCASAAGT